MKKRLVSSLLTLLFLVAFIPIASTSAMAAGPSSDEEIAVRIDELYNSLSGEYFNVGHVKEDCGTKSSGHGCDNCLITSIMKAQWFQNKFGTIKTSQLPIIATGQKSCMGFVNFAMWYIFRANNSDSVDRISSSKMDFNYANVSNYARIGDYLRLGDKHSVIYISCDTNGITVLDCNYSGDYNCLVQKHTISYKEYSKFFIVRAYSKSGEMPTNPFPKTNDTQNISILTAVSGKWTVTVPANYKLLCYPNVTSTTNSTYISAKSAAYVLTCTQKATLSNGKTRYFFVSGDNKNLWFDFASGMTVAGSDNNKPETTTYTVSFNANGGSTPQSSKAVTPGLTYGTLPTPTRSGYDFDGWYTSASGGSKVTSSTTFNGSSNITLYAHWTAKPIEKNIKITFDANGGRTSQSSKTIVAGSYLTGLPTATRSGYTFLGWGMDKIDPNSPLAQTTTIVSENMYSFDEDTTLYAYWSKDKNPESAPHTHVKKKSGVVKTWSSDHPHYVYYPCADCGELFTEYETTTMQDCEVCYPPKNPAPTWGPWSEWSTTPVYASSTRQVDTRSVQISAGATEYRYGRYIDSTGSHICWCSTYLGSKGYSGITVQYSSWSTTRYGANGKVWTCGNCTGSHTGIDHYDSQGRPAWKEYSLSSGSYYWEESRQTSATYETQYRYRDLIS